MFENHEPYRIQGYRGLYLRGPAEACPPDRLLEANNVIFGPGTVRSRAGLQNAVDYPQAAGFQDFALYDFFGASYFLRSFNTAGIGTLVDRRSGNTIITAAGWSSFKIVQNNDYVYILLNSSSFSLYVWKTSWVSARVAAGAAPTSGFALSATNGAAVPNAPAAGHYVFGVYYETETGHYTKIGPYVGGVKTLTHFQADGAHAIVIATIPTGPAGTLYRHLVCSRVSQSWDGNFDAHELFHLDTIADNVTVTKTYNNIYSDALVDSRDYLLDILETIPYAVGGLSIWNNRLVLYGDNTDRNVIRVSKIGAFETFDSVDSIINTPNKCYTGVNCVGELRGTFYVFKDGATIAYTDDSEFPSEWTYLTLDTSRNTTSVAKSTQDKSVVDDKMLVISDGKLMSFNGTYGEDISANLDLNLWDLGARGDNHLINCHQENYILIYTNNNIVYYGDYTDGLSAEGIKWAIHDYSNIGSTLVKLLIDKGIPYYGFIVANTRILYGHVNTEMDSDWNLQDDQGGLLLPDSVAINAYVRLPFVGKSNIKSQFSGFAAHVRSYNRDVGQTTSSLLITIYGRDDVKTLTPRAITFSKGKHVERTFNLVNDMCSIRIGTNALQNSFELNDFVIYGKELWAVAPNE